MWIIGWTSQRFGHTKMLRFLLALLLIAAPAAAHDQQQLEYKTSFLVQWVMVCSQQIAPLYLAQGLPEHYAFARAANDCSCAIDGFREDHTFAALQAMSFEDRQEFGNGYAARCAGQIKEL